jgi:hypothetical protein
MKIYCLLFLFLLAGCDRVNEEESAFVSRWTWHAEVDEFTEFGYLELRSDRTYSFHHEMKNPTETLSISHPYDYHYPWRLNNGQICYRTSSEGEQPLEEECPWIARTGSNGEPVLSLYGGMVGMEIFAEKEEL